jgi:hypothetical protein
VPPLGNQWPITRYDNIRSVDGGKSIEARLSFHQISSLFFLNRFTRGTFTMAKPFRFTNKLTILVLFLSLARSVRSDLVIFEAGLIANSSNVALAGTLSQECITAMEETITCDPFLRSQVMTDEFTYLTPSVRDVICTTSCGQSLSSYHDTVESACSSSPQPWDNTPATFYGDQLWAQYNISCFKNTAGDYCQSRPRKTRTRLDLQLT